MKGYKLIILLLCFCINAHAQINKDTLVWGVNAVTIGPVKPNEADLKRLLANNKIISLDRFYRVGGENISATPTECRLAYGEDSLFIVFRCTENNMLYPWKDHDLNWNILNSTPIEQDAAFPDKVDLFIRPTFSNPAYYHFTVTKEGLQFSKEDHISDSGKSYPQREKKLAPFSSTVISQEKEWIVFLRIPWNAIGGKPKGYFGIIPFRTRWRNGEASSPIALDFGDRPPADLYMEAILGEHAKIYRTDRMLTRLPSGLLRWQRPVDLRHPSSEILRQIWKLQQSLKQTTNSGNFDKRVDLTQQWVNLLELEGFNFSATTGSIVQENLFPAVIRKSVNEALCNENINEACKLLDSYLHKLDKVSRKWFADTSPGDILEKVWKSISGVTQIKEKNNVLQIHCTSGNHKLCLNLSLPQTGGIRLWANKKGYFNAKGLLPLTIRKKAGKYEIIYSYGRILVSERPFKISFYNNTAKKLLDINARDISCLFNAQGKITAFDFRSSLNKEEVIFGFGERYDQFDQRGNVLTLWGMDDWNGNTVGLANETYKPIPVFHSSKGYMVFINSSYRLRADIGKTQADEYRITQQGPVFDYYIWLCSPQDALQSYTNLTGKPILPPRWAFEPWMGRTGRAWASSPLHDPVAEQKAVIKQFAEMDIPHSAIYAEGNGADNAALYNFLAPHDIKALSWYFPAISQKVQKELMPELRAEQLPILRFSDTIHSIAHDINYVDFTNPKAKTLADRWWKHRLDLGVAGSMVDFGDRVPEDAVFYDGRKGDEMHNFYAYDYHRTYSEVFKKRRGDDFILFARSAAPGDQKWICQFAGDHASNFKGLKDNLNGLLNLSACGFSTWGSDLGGFRAQPEPDLYIRWTQFSCFSPLMRCHGRTPREPWDYGQAAVTNYRRYTWVRENLLDYIYNEAMHSHETGIPMIRSLGLAYPEEKHLAAVDNQYFFGRDLLVAPVTNDDTSRSIIFPPGKWISLWDGESRESGSAKIKVPLDVIPIYLKVGAIIPVSLNNQLQLGESMTNNKVSALIITPPSVNTSKKLQNIHGTKAEVELQVGKNGFATFLENYPEKLYLIVYTLHLSGVKVNGEKLPLLKGDQLMNLPPGWFMDSVNKRVIIRLPNGVKRKVEVSY